MYLNYKSRIRSALFKGVLSLFSLGIFLSACKPKEDFVGKEYVIAPADLQVISFAAPDKSTPVDFTADSASFSAQFSHRVSWFLTLTGLKSGAVKKIEGLSDRIDPNLIKWGGNHDGLYFFKNEPVVAEITFLKSSLVAADTFNIGTPKKYEGTLLFDGFEKKFSNSWPGDFSFQEDGEVTPDVLKRDSSVTPIEGKWNFKMSGQDANTSYFICGMRAQKDQPKPENMPAKDTLYMDFDSFDPNEVYFNVYVYGNGATGTRASIAVAEDDNGNAMYEDPIEDSWEYPFKVTWVGWKLISVKYADFSRAADKNFGGNGNGIKELNKAKSITFNLLSDPPGGHAEYSFDFPIITYGGAFNPQQ